MQKQMMSTGQEILVDASCLSEERLNHFTCTQLSYLVL